MADTTAIEWADATFNPWMGCEPAGPGCKLCYAKRWVERFGDDFRRRQRTSAANWRQPLAWDAKHAAFFADHGRRRRVFCASLADVFDNKVPAEWRRDLFDLIARTPNLDWLLLTKRIGNAERMVMEALRGLFLHSNTEPATWPWPNVWLGATVVNQVEADRDIPKLLAVPARKRFLSMEPLLGSVQIWPYTSPHCERHRGALDADGKCEVCESRGIWRIGEPLAAHEKAPIRPGIDWVIAGGESGPHARPMHPDWARGLRDQCEAAGVPFLFKQWGEWLPDAPPCGTPENAPLEWIGANQYAIRVGKKSAGRLLDGRTHDGFPEATA
ncbi:phage Gp37/Gp68 family protein [Roseateles cavernae]|uniref:phage Gp37/Gp68 family protein n=1 Tax=Roseateles cavernae TaxID=3153578 RepID=UPI0032E4F37E